MTSESDSGESDKNSFHEFCQQTSLHGWQYLGKGGGTKGKIVWLFIVLASLGVASVFLFTQAEDFLNRSVVTTIQTTTASLQVSALNFFASFFAIVHLCNTPNLKCKLSRKNEPSKGSLNAQNYISL